MKTSDWSQVMPLLLRGEVNELIKLNAKEIDIYLKNKFGLKLDNNYHLRKYSRTRPLGIASPRNKSALLYRVYFEVLARLTSLPDDASILYTSLQQYVLTQEGLDNSASAQLQPYLKDVLAKLCQDGILMQKEASEENVLYVKVQHPTPPKEIVLTADSPVVKARQELLLNGFYRHEGTMHSSTLKSLEESFERFYDYDSQTGLRLLAYENYFILADYSGSGFPNTVQGNVGTLAVEMLSQLSQKSFWSPLELFDLAKTTATYANSTGLKTEVTLKSKVKEIITWFTYYGMLTPRDHGYEITSLTSFITKEKSQGEVHGTL
ncbi:hypothetical protein [Ligilactobacillus equi]|uniref:Uncharacterized protein n=1 Tax=Ligilactobacillus equi DSM 15833 = JCM 10991 TaxID=1423740 RepID=A0A0R1TMM1_9LACO|nr:hypothetical protein [Ligilactobacillus equi]KRL82719.1 hypothetical protein FC36_GL000890 [Ligilactobacillus equi DSM 15833 = JCM 10991]